MKDRTSLRLALLACNMALLIVQLSIHIHAQMLRTEGIDAWNHATREYEKAKDMYNRAAAICGKPAGPVHTVSWKP